MCSLLINSQLELSSPPAPSTLAHAEIVLTMGKAASEEPPELTWKRIMEEEPTSTYLSFTVPTHEDDEEAGTSPVQLEQLSTDLDSTIKFIRKSVEGLSVGTSETAATFGVLSFMLEDWDL